MANSTNLSGKFVVRVDPKLHKALRKEAQEKGESLNSLCVHKLSGRTLENPWVNIVEVIVKGYQPLGIALFGSVARGENKESSDVDLLIVLNSSETVDRDCYRKWDKLFSGNTKLSPQFVHQPRSNEAIGSIWLETAMDAEVLYDPSGQLKKTFLDIRKEIARGAYLRKESYGHSYWIRQDINAK